MIQSDILLDKHWKRPEVRSRRVVWGLHTHQYCLFLSASYKADNPLRRIRSWESPITFLNLLNIQFFSILNHNGQYSEEGDRVEPQGSWQNHWIWWCLILGSKTGHIHCVLSGKLSLSAILALMVFTSMDFLHCPNPLSRKKKKEIMVEEQMDMGLNGKETHWSWVKHLNVGRRWNNIRKVFALPTPHGS